MLSLFRLITNLKDLTEKRLKTMEETMDRNSESIEQMSQKIAELKAANVKALETGASNRKKKQVPKRVQVSLCDNLCDN